MLLPCSEVFMTTRQPHFLVLGPQPPGTRSLCLLCVITHTSCTGLLRCSRSGVLESSDHLWSPPNRLYCLCSRDPRVPSSLAPLNCPNYNPMSLLPLSNVWNFWNALKSQDTTLWSPVPMVQFPLQRNPDPLGGHRGLLPSRLGGPLLPRARRLPV